MNAGAGLRLRRDARLAGGLYLVVVLSGIFSLAWAPTQTDGGIAVAAANLGVFRAGIAAFLIMQVAFLLLPLAMYQVLGDVNRRVSALMVVLAITSVPMGLVALTHRLDALALLQGSGVGTHTTMAAAFSDALAQYGHGLRIASLFWGLWLLPFGWLVLRSGRLPRILGVLLILGGLGYVLRVFGGLVPEFAAMAWFNYVTLPAACGEIGSCVWLLLFGVRAGMPASTDH